MIDAEPGQPSKAPRKAPLWFWSLALVFLAMLTLPISLILSNRFSKFGTEWQPVSLHSILESDYSADLRSTRFPAVKLDLIKAAIQDQSAGEDLDRFEEIIISLLTPVATVQSGFPLANATPTTTQLTTLTPTQTPTNWGSAPTRTPRPTITPTLTATRTTPTQTLKPTLEPATSPTRTPTRPPRKPQPTNTPRPTQEPTNPPPTKTAKSPPPREPTKPPPTQDPYPPPDTPKPTQDPYP